MVNIEAATQKNNTNEIDDGKEIHSIRTGAGGQTCA